MLAWACASLGRGIGYVWASTESEALEKAAARWPALAEYLTVYRWDEVL